MTLRFNVEFILYLAFGTDSNDKISVLKAGIYFLDLGGNRTWTPLRVVERSIIALYGRHIF